MTPNYSIYSIPIYWLLAMAPHAYGISVIKSANNKKWNNANPRGAETCELYKKVVPRDVFQRFERAEAAHKNLMEGAPWFIGAIVLGNAMGMPAYHLNFVAAGHLLTRVVYIYAYINIARTKYSAVRSLLWGIAMGFLLDLFVKLGKKASSVPA